MDQCFGDFHVAYYTRALLCTMDINGQLASVSLKAISKTVHYLQPRNISTQQIEMYRFLLRRVPEQNVVQINHHVV